MIRKCQRSPHYKKAVKVSLFVKSKANNDLLGSQTPKCDHAKVYLDLKVTMWGLKVTNSKFFFQFSKSLTRFPKLRDCAMKNLLF